MWETYEDYLSQIEEEAIKAGFADFRLAREEFHNATGKFEDGEAWFELRMKMFIDWYLLDRAGSSGATPTEEYLLRYGASLPPDVRRQIAHLTVTLRSAFRIEKIVGSLITLEDLGGGGRWEVESTGPTAGLGKEDIIDTRVIFFRGKLIIGGGGTVLHPKAAHEAILSIVARARAEEMPRRAIVDHLDKMRLKLDKYSNVHIPHIYRYPDDARL